MTPLQKRMALITAIAICCLSILIFIVKKIFFTATTKNEATPAVNVPGNQAPLNLIEETYSAKEAYDFHLGCRKKIAYLFRLSFPKVGLQLVTDNPLQDPENPGTKFKAIGGIDSIFWKGGPIDPIHITFRVSPSNHSVLQEALDSLKGGTEIEAEWAAYDYDPLQKKYFKHFHTNSQPIVFILSKETQVSLNAYPDNEIEHPLNFLVDMSLTPKKVNEVQELSYAYSATSEPLTRRIGVEASLPDELQNKSNLEIKNNTTQGLLTLDNGDKYKGEINDGLPNGKGILINAKGIKYKGTFVLGKLEGLGTCTWPSGQKYKGNFFEGKLHGKGIVKLANGDRFEGDFLNNKQTGHGSFTWINGDTYIGDYVDGKRHGRGKLILKGKIYEGKFVENKYMGK